MVTRRRSEPDPPRSRRRPATTPEGQESHMVSLAVQAAEKQLKDGTASAQVITHYLKLGSSRERLEQKRLEHENELLQTKREAIESQKQMSDLFTNALDAFRTYSTGQASTDHGDEFDG